MSNESIAARALFGATIGIFKLIFIIFRVFYRGIMAIVDAEKAKRDAKPKDLFLTNESRFEHTLVLGGSGWGKTQFLQHSFLRQDLNASLRSKTVSCYY